MDKEKTTISLELLLLNDLLNTNVIDKSIYEKAAQKIVSFNRPEQMEIQPIILASA